MTSEVDGQPVAAHNDQYMSYYKRKGQVKKIYD